MLDTLLWLAIASGLVSTITRNGTAYALLASVAVCLALQNAEAPFDPVLWMAIDVVVMLAIVRPGMTRADWLVMILFAPAWVGYLLPPDPRYLIGTLVVIVQFLAIFPTKRVLSRACRTLPHQPAWRDFDLRVYSESFA
jgi:hypothetical protein